MTNSLRTVGSIWGEGAKRAAIRLLPVLLMSIAVMLTAGASAYASALDIIPTFDTSITSDPNAAVIEGTINSVINYYDTTFTTATASPIDVTIDFKEGGGLGASSTLVGQVSYQAFINALVAASSGGATDTTALAHLPIGPNNPVNGSTVIDVKTANLRALGFATALPPGVFDGVITLNTSLTTPGSPGSSLQYSLFAVTSHEIDEVLGLGSFAGSAGSHGFFDQPSPEDLLRYNGTGGRSFTSNSLAKAYFSLDGTTLLKQFDNQNDGGDFGDWQSNPLPSGVAPSVQDAFATIGSSPTLATDAGTPEIIALDAIGYNLASVPEPGTLFLLGTGLATVLASKRRKLLS
jgi:hypothetical protein